jgi:hypothetical protein
VPGIDHPYRNVEAVGQGSLFLLEALHYWLQCFADKEQQDALQKRWNEEEPNWQEYLQKGQGVVVWVEYTQQRQLEGAVVTASPTFVDLHWSPGTRHQRPPETVRGAGETPILEQHYYAPPKEAAQQLNEGAIKTRLSELWAKQKTLQKNGERMSREWALGRWLQGRTKTTIDLSPVYEARAHLSSANAAVKQDRLSDAATSMDAAEKALDQMWENIMAYRGKVTFDD